MREGGDRRTPLLMNCRRRGPNRARLTPAVTILLSVAHGDGANARARTTVSRCSIASGEDLAAGQSNKQATNHACQPPHTWQRHQLTQASTYP